MAENPLLPDAELRALLALTKRCATLDAAAARKASKAPGASLKVPPTREAMLAATMLQLQPGDLLVGDPNDTTAAALAPAPLKPAAAGASTLPAGTKNSSRLMLATAMAAALKAGGTDRLVLGSVRAGTPQPEWAGALAWAQERLLPLILLCADPGGSSAFRGSPRQKPGAFEWGAVERSAAQLQMPILCVDGEDAVAVYRVMQESVLRARAGGGPAVLWAMLPSARELKAGRPRGAKPLGRLERYLRARRIAF